MGGIHDDYISTSSYIYFSGTKSTLNFFIRHTKYEWDNGTEIKSGDLNQIQKNYNNMVTDKEWNKVDPKDAIIIALTTHKYKLL